MANTATKKVAPKKAATKEAPEGIYAYSVKRKEKVLVHDALISPTGKGSFIAKGTDDEGNKVAAIMSAANAEAAVENGWGEWAEQPKAAAKKVAVKKK